MKYSYNLSNQTEIFKNMQPQLEIDNIGINYNQMQNQGNISGNYYEQSQGRNIIPLKSGNFSQINPQLGNSLNSSMNSQNLGNQAERTNQQQTSNLNNNGQKQRKKSQVIIQKDSHEYEID